MSANSPSISDLLTGSTNYDSSKSLKKRSTKRFTFNIINEPIQAKKTQTEESARPKLQNFKLNQIQEILEENQKLRESINNKQKIIDTITRQKECHQRVKLTLDSIPRNQGSVRSLLQPSVKLTSISTEQMLAKMKNKYKLPSLNDQSKRLVTSPTEKKEALNFTFAQNMLKQVKSTPSTHRLNMLEAFPQYQLQKKFCA